jgi:hypothetical protein
VKAPQKRTTRRLRLFLVIVSPFMKKRSSKLRARKDPSLAS